MADRRHTPFIAVEAVSPRSSSAPPRTSIYTVGMPLLRVSDPAYLPELLEELTARPDCLAEVVGPNRVQVSVLGSYNTDALELEVELRVRAWQNAQLARGLDVGIDVEHRH
jgi:hypothetical protein